MNEFSMRLTFDPSDTSQGDQGTIYGDNGCEPMDGEAAAILAALGCEVYGADLVAVIDFDDYAREFAEDIGAVEEQASWPAYCIDWARAAHELSMDYTLVEFRGREFYARER